MSIIKIIVFFAVSVILINLPGSFAQEFDDVMRDLGYDDDAIRKSKALLGKIPHQQGEFAPE